MLHYQEEALNPNPQENHPPKSEYFSQYVIQYVIGLVHHYSANRKIVPVVAEGEDVDPLLLMFLQCIFVSATTTRLRPCFLAL